MYAAVITVPLAPDTLEEAHRAYEASMLPIVQQLPGFRGPQVLADRATGNLMAIALYETEADAQAAGTNAEVQQAQRQLARFMTGTPAREVFEVTLQA